jgi:hypothetical protein
MKALREMNPDKKFWPDANSTLRIGYGKVQSMQPRDGITYSWFSTLDGIIEKSASDNPDYQIPNEFTKAATSKDYGRYGQNGTVPVGYLASCHTTGGNSGSPEINAKGQLVGVNYDGVWEGLTGDYDYNEKLTRNISVDIRYVLFITDKVYHCQRLIDEMKIVDK